MNIINVLFYFILLPLQIIVHYSSRNPQKFETENAKLNQL